MIYLLSLSGDALRGAISENRRYAEAESYAAHERQCLPRREMHVSIHRETGDGVASTWRVYLIYVMIMKHCRQHDTASADESAKATTKWRASPLFVARLS